MKRCKDIFKTQVAASPLQLGSTSGLWCISEPFSALLPSVGTNDLYEGIFQYLVFVCNSSPLLGIGSLASVDAFAGAATEDLDSVTRV